MTPYPTAGAPQVVTPLPIRVDPAEVWRLLSYPQGRSPADPTRRRIDAELRHAIGWIQARGAYRVESANASVELRLPPPAHRSGSSGSKEPPSALALGLVTIGGMLEEQIRHRLAANDASGALLVDAIGSAAAEAAADALSEVILAAVGSADRAGAPHPYRGCRVSPGYGDWPLDAQPRLFARLPHDEIGVALLPSQLMIPRKSISFALWLGADGRPLSDLAGCARCPHLHCAQRRS